MRSFFSDHCNILISLLGGLVAFDLLLIFIMALSCVEIPRVFVDVAFCLTGGFTAAFHTHRMHGPRK